MPITSISSQSWHSLTAEEVSHTLACTVAQGLSQDEVKQRLQQFGQNALPEKPPRPAWLKFVDQFKSLLVLILLAAGGLAAAIGDTKDALVIVFVVLFNASLGFLQEYRAENALASLKQMLAPTAKVRRAGELQQISALELVPGDLLFLEAGDRVPADARVIHAYNAELAEAALTGESQVVGKTNARVAADAPLAERHNMVFMNTVLTRGRIEAMVVATGLQTEMGRLAAMLAAAEEASTPLQDQLDSLGKRLALIAAIVVSIMFAAGLWRGDGLAHTLMTAIALAVAAIPEGLPAVVTVTLALGMHRMAKHHAVVKKLAAVETLGCTTVICSDKTGTLTLNAMTARRLFALGQQWQISGEGYSRDGGVTPLTTQSNNLPPSTALAAVLPPAVLCTTSRLHYAAENASATLVGDPTEGALLALAAKLGCHQETAQAAFPCLAEIPFDSAYKFMATFHQNGEWVDMWVKGAPDVLLARATSYQGASGVLPLDAPAAAEFMQCNADFAGQALRVLALAGRRIPAAQFVATDDLLPWVQELNVLALVGMIDPPRPEAKSAIQQCHAAGIKVKMITGDHPATAAAIAHELGLQGAVHQGKELNALPRPALNALLDASAVFARVAPEHKLQIVQALQAQGHVVAMTGDGVNDAPALQAADIGIAMGITGTEVSKEAATLVLTDDNFASIVRAVQEGRTIYDNIVKFVRFQLATNLGAIFTVLGAALCGFATPFTAIQILWVNIIMDGPPAMTLGVEPAHPHLMRHAPRRATAAILSWQRLWRIALYGLTMAVGTLYAYAAGLNETNLAGDSLGKASTLAFTTFVLFQFFNIFNARAEYGTAFNRQFFHNGKLWGAILSVVLLQIVVVHWPPAQAIFATQALSLQEWGMCSAIAASTLVLEEGRKLLLFLYRSVCSKH